MPANSSSDVAAKIEQWRSQLLDTSKRNRLINFKSGRSGGVAILHPGTDAVWDRLVAGNGGMTFAWKRDLAPEPEAHEVGRGRERVSLLDEDSGTDQAPEGQTELSRCLESFRLREDDLLTDMPDKKLASRLGSLALNARTALSEMGVTTLYLVVGLLRWFEREDSKVESLAPLLLIPARLDRESVESPWTLRLEDQEVGSNHSLVQLLKNDYNLQLPPVPEEFEVEDPNARHAYYEQVRHSVRHLPRWEVLDVPALGVFNFQKVAMWKDLGKNREKIAAHGICRAIAGDRGSLPAQPGGLPGDRQLDAETRPELTHHILDCDSSQHAAVEAVKKGASLVLDGPPGTGKSQTIANMIGEALADGKSVLFVSEKSAALEVVKRRLDSRDLGDFCLECHGHKVNKKTVVVELGRCLNLGAETYPDRTEDLGRLFEARARLNAYVHALHAVRQPLGLSAYQVHGRLAEIKVEGQTRCPVPDPASVDPAALRGLTGLLDGLADCRGAIDDCATHPWRGVRSTPYSLNRRDDIVHHTGRLARGLAAVTEACPALSRLGFGPESPTLAGWVASLDEAVEALKFPEVPAGWFETDPRRVAAGFIELDGLTKLHREAWSALPELSRGAVRDVDADRLKGFAVPNGGELEGKLVRPGTTAMRRRDGLGAVVASLRATAERAASVQGAMDRVTSVLHVPARPLALRGVAKVLEQFRVLARMGPARPPWFDPARRHELQQVLQRCRDDDAQNARVRAKLVVRLAPSAFADESAGIASRSASFRPGWSRLLPAWWSYKAKAALLYAGDSPPTAAMLDDLGELASYHRRRDYARQAARQYADALLSTASGTPDWVRTLEGMKAAEQVAPLVSAHAGLEHVLGAPGRIDAQALASAVDELVEAYQAFKSEFQAADRFVGLAKLLDSDPRWGGSTFPDFTARLLAEATTFENQRAALERVGRLLKPGHDVLWDQVPGRLQTLRRLGELGPQLAEARAKLAPVLPADPLAEDSDWGGQAAVGRWLLDFLETHAGTPPGHLVGALTRADVRADLAEAVRKNRACRTSELFESWKSLCAEFPGDKPVSTGIVLGGASVGELAAWTAGRAADVHRLQEWLRFREYAAKAKELGLQPLMAELVQKALPVDDARGAFLRRFYRAWLDAVVSRDEALRHFDSERHERVIEEFRTLDRESVRNAPNRIRQKLLNDPARPRAAAGDAPGASELGTLLREVNKKARHLPLRHLFARTPTLLRRLKPCLMMSPLAVSTYLDSDQIRFDLVIFDEASQVRPYDAISAIYRGKQLVVAGDQKQLPPTNFFGRADGGDDLSSDSDDATDDSLDDYESILDVCCTLGLPRKRLRWHYRSRREPLIAFSNRHFYDNDLVSFPSVHDVDGSPAVRFEYLSGGRWLTGRNGGYNPADAQRTAELVFEHFRDHPGQTLGVIAFNQRQQLAILDELEKRRTDDPSMEPFFAESRDEPFFVKNLENVQGDERDVIFLSVAYGPDENRKVSMNFGPLNKKGGERRLNVAVTRAKSAMTVISSLRAPDIDLSRSDAVGVRLFRAYLDFAERGPEALRSEVTADGEHGYDSPFEKEVAEELTRRGMLVHGQVGCGGFRIDLALMDPDRPGRYVLGVECDGATYHSSATARDRDRLRQAVLESLGWRISRIWSTDWAHDPAGQIDRVLADFAAAREAPDGPHREGGSTGAAVPEPADVPLPVPEPAPATVRLAEPPSYRSIDEVPQGTIRGLLLDSLTRFGTTGEAELVKSVTRQLGFQRAGARITARLTGCLDDLARDGKVSRAGDGGVRILAAANARSG